VRTFSGQEKVDFFSDLFHGRLALTILQRQDKILGLGLGLKIDQLIYYRIINYRFIIFTFVLKKCKRFNFS